MGLTPERIRDTLAECAAALDRVDVPFAVAGAFAVAMHGHARATRDIDVLVLLTDRDAARHAPERIGCDCTLQSHAFAHLERRPMPVLPGAVERSDLLFSSRPSARRAIQTATRRLLPWARGVLPEVPLDTLLPMKGMAASADPRRLQDLVDVRALMAQHGATLDRQQLRVMAAELGHDVTRLPDEQIEQATRGVGEDVAAALASEPCTPQQLADMARRLDGCIEVSALCLSLALAGEMARSAVAQADLVAATHTPDAIQDAIQDTHQSGRREIDAEPLCVEMMPAAAVDSVHRLAGQ